MSLLYKAKPLKEGYQVVVNPENADLKWLEFGRLMLKRIGEEYTDESKEKEIALNVLKGSCDLEIEGEPWGKINYQGIGGRRDVFLDLPIMAYIPKEARYTIKCQSDILDIGFFKAPSRKKTRPCLIESDQVQVVSVGAGNWQRKVYTSIGDKVDADRLLVGETLNPPGNWSSYPPHKHDVDNPPQEAPLEEIYFFLIKPVQGFGIQRIYTPPEAKDALNEVYLVENNDTVVIPRGYHPVVAGAGYQLCYCWALAGEERKYGAWSDDPQHNWVKNCQSLLKG